MIDCISVENMRESDAYTIDNFVPSLELMYRAAYGVFQSVKWTQKIAIVVGSGNNGGDGFALAYILHEQGYSCKVFTLSQKFSPDSSHYAEKAKSVGIPILDFTEGCLEGEEIIVDCLLGTGFQGNLRTNYKDAIQSINNTNAYVVSVDINSGMNGDTGEAELAVHSDLTVTIGYVKTGMILENAGKYIKKLRCVDIGIVLVKEEAKICNEIEWERSKQEKTTIYRCPPWLDMEILNVTIKK